MKLKIKFINDNTIEVYGAVEYAQKHPIDALWFAWTLCYFRIMAYYYSLNSLLPDEEYHLEIEISDKGEFSFSELLKYLRRNKE